MKGLWKFFQARNSMSVLNGARTALGLLLCALLTAALPVYGQDTGYISGTVIDKSGAAVAGAEVTLTSTSGNLTRTTTTNGDGLYTIAGLPGGTYNVSVSAKGFQKNTTQNVKLDVAEKARVDVQLTVGAMSEEVTVTG